MIHTIALDVYCSNSGGEPIYRIYVNDDLLTERTWIWTTYDTYIRENIEVDIDPGTHRLSIEKLKDSVKFIAKNLTVDGNLVQIHNQQNLTFTV
jgi:hypothetical protein